MDDINRVTQTGFVASKPEQRKTEHGHFYKFRSCTTRGYKDKTFSNYHNIVVYSQHLLDVAAGLKENDRILLEGTLQTRSYENASGEKTWITEVVLNGFTAQLLSFNGETGEVINEADKPIEAELDDEIPF